MKINQAEFVISAVSPAQYPKDALPEIALAGRSNVGKSSLINRMINRKNLARTSSQPGKTQMLNYYRVNGELYFVDVPGYGFARVPQSVREKWGRMMEQYFRERRQLKLVLLVVDIRHPPTDDDKSMYDWLKYYRIPMCVVATKADKIARGHWQKHLNIIKEKLQCSPSDPVLAFSAETGQGRDELWAIIKKAIRPLPSAEETNG